MKNSKRFKVTDEFKQAIHEFSKNRGFPRYQIAARANVTPSILSAALNDSLLFYPDDPRIKRIAKVIKFRKECFLLKP